MGIHRGGGVAGMGGTSLFEDARWAAVGSPMTKAFVRPERTGSAGAGGK